MGSSAFLTGLGLLTGRSNLILKGMEMDQAAKQRGVLSNAWGDLFSGRGGAMPPGGAGTPQATYSPPGAPGPSLITPTRFGPSPTSPAGGARAASEIQGAGGIDPGSLDLITRTVLAEAGGEGPEGMAAVANVIRNRMRAGRYGGTTAAGVVKAPSQFEPWNTSEGRAKIAGFDPQSPTYRAAAGIVERIFSGGETDPTGGATHFLAPGLQRSLGRNMPAWASGNPLATIGGHSFYAPEGVVGGGAPAATAGAPAAGAAPSSAPQAVAGFLSRFSPQQRQALSILAQNNPAVGNALIQRLITPQQTQTTDDLREYAFARQQGYEGSFLDFMQAKRAQGGRGLSFQRQGNDIVGLDPATGREMSRIEGQTPPPQATDDIREYQLAKEQGFKGSFMDYMKQRGGGQGALPAEAQLYEFDMQQRAARGEKRIPFSEWSKDRRAGRDRSFDQETKLRGEFTQQTKTFGIVHDAFGRIASIVQERAQNPEAVSPASDIALVFAYMKMLDPESVVREGEFATAQNAGGVPERIQNLYNKALGGEFLTNEQRQDMIDTASRIYGQTRQTAEAIRDRYQDLAERYQVDPNRVVTLPATIEPARVGQRRGMKTAPAEPPVKSPRVRPQQVPPSLDTKTLPRVRTQTEFNALPKGSLYVEIDPEGKEILFRKP